MKPLISRVRAGDVLLGTKNLRTYLQMASLCRIALYGQAHGLAERRGRHDIVRGGPVLYSPNKSDQFIVLANTDDRFAVWSSNQNLVLLFVNPCPKGAAPKTLGTRRVVSIPQPLLKPGQFVPSGGVEWRYVAPRMTPEIFSSWFIKTRLKNVDLTQWPDYAWYLHVSLQHGVTSQGKPRDSRGAGAFSFVSHLGQWEIDAPFKLAEWNKGSQRAQMARLATKLLERGIGRTTANRPSSLGMNHGYGPLLGDIPVIKNKIREAAQNPRQYRWLVNLYSEELGGGSSVKGILEKLEKELGDKVTF